MSVSDGENTRGVETDPWADVPEVSVPAKLGVSGERAIELLDTVVRDIGGAKRQGQREMCIEVARAIDGGENLVVQAGTGTGKSLGYLVPAVLAARNARVVISTATLGLQRQLVVKDIPAVLAALKRMGEPSPRIAILKGWNHYLCKARLEGVYPADALFAIDEGATSSKFMKELRRLRKWITDTGDRDDLQPGVTDRIWRHVSLPRNRCVGNKCDFYEECYAVMARESAAQADIVITNHAIMGVAATANASIIGEPDVVIVDEGHALSDCVRSQATQCLSVSSLQTLLRAVRTAGAGELASLQEAITALSDVLSRLDEGLLEGIPPELLDTCSLLDSALREAASTLSEQKDSTAQIVKGDIQETQDIVAAAADTLLVRWVEHSGEEPSLLCAPLSVAGMIRASFADKGRLIITSATLKSGGSFDSIGVTCGLNQALSPWQAIDVASPFDYAKMGICYIAEDLPAPSTPGITEISLRRLADLIAASGGGALCLFSSYKALDEAKSYLCDVLDEHNILVQGEGQLSTLIDEFIADRDSTLLGTMSLWQGIDAAGATCRLVVIDRIPFPHPANPLIQAQNRAAEQKGMSSFGVVSLPHAGLLLSQGAGRLIRSASDRGVLALLDSRLLTKSYGSYLRRDLPNMWPTKDLDTVLGALKRLRDSLDEKAGL